MKNKKGFTLVELIIVIVIVGILSIVAVPVYKGYIKKAMATEGKALLGSVLTAEKVYFAEYNNYKDVEGTDYDRVLDVDARSNKYFKAYGVENIGSEADASFMAYALGEEGGPADQIYIIMIGQSKGEPRMFEAHSEDEAYEIVTKYFGS